MECGTWVIDEKMKKCDLPQKVATAFGEATNGLTGAEYLPVLYVGQQVVAGMNYMLICKQRLLTATPIENIVEMIIYKDCGCNPAVIKGIKTILDSNIVIDGGRFTK